ncbi:MAG: peptidoglycan-binding domain-containing protein [Christensenellales bacterium]|jgi:peptidoglycan hydrolase-like protein with peptidoglycan-binding domain
MKSMKKWLLLCLAALMLFIVSGCSAPQEDSVEDPLGAFNIDAVVPYETANPATLTTPAPQLTADPNMDPTQVDQPWKEETLDPTPRPSVSEPTYSILMRGDSGSAVEKLQKRLKELGYYTGDVDGSYGSSTVTAVKRFEAAMGGTQTGVASSSLQKQLFSDSAPYGSASTDPQEPPKPQETKKPAPQATQKPSGYTMLSKGSSGSMVSKLQSRLKELGYYSGGIDGSYGNATVAAVKKFQRALGLEQTGAATAALQKKLYAKSAPAYEGDEEPAPTKSPAYTELSRGDTGARVSKLQRRLKELGYYTGNVDGDYGSATIAAVKRFEAAYGKVPTGIATVPLQKKLFSGDALFYGDADEEDDGYTTLSPGDTGEAVKRLQKRLKALGYFSGSIGGNYLTLTTDAVKLFQKTLGLKQTGIATVALQKKLFSADAPKYDATPTDPPSGGYTTLSRGDVNDAVKRMQARLKELGYYSGSVNGNFGAKTEKAVMKFEAAYGRAETGVATPELQKKLFSPSARVYTGDPEPEPTQAAYKTLKKGSSGTAVRKLQKRLAQLGYYSGSVNGNFGVQTENAVKSFQQAIGMEITGVATPETQEMLFDDQAPSQGDRYDTEDGANALRRGDKGEEVTRLQMRLVELGYLTSMAAVKKGTYDAKTMQAVIDAQLDRDVETDGVATEDFLEYIYSEAAEELVALLYGRY